MAIDNCPNKQKFTSRYLSLKMSYRLETGVKMMAKIWRIREI
jgi:hypothetical protein